MLCTGGGLMVAEGLQTLSRISCSIWLRASRSSTTRRSATRPPITTVLRLVRSTTRATPIRPLATTTSTRPTPRCPLAPPLRANLLDRMHQPIHGRNHRDGHEGHHRPDQDHQPWLHDRDHVLGPELDLGPVVLGCFLQGGVECPGLLAN